MHKAQNGDTVKIHYSGKLEDGTVVESTTGTNPLVFKLGEGRLIPGLEKAIAGMTPGESKTTRVQASQAFGAYNLNLTKQFTTNYYYST